MKKFFIKTAWHHYAITIIIITVLFVLRETDIRTVGIAGFYGLCTVTLVLAIVVSFAIALNMGLKNIYLNWLYPIFSALFAYLILPLMAFITCYRHVHPESFYYFGHYLAFGFTFIFLVFLIVTLIGMGIGVLIRKKRIKKE